MMIIPVDCMNCNMGSGYIQYFVAIEVQDIKYGHHEAYSQFVVVKSLE